MVVIHEDHLRCPTRSVTCSPGSVGMVHCSVRPESDHTSTCSLVFARTVVTATVSLFGGPLKPYDVAYLCAQFGPTNCYTKFYFELIVTTAQKRRKRLSIILKIKYTRKPTRKRTVYTRFESGGVLLILIY